MARLAVICLKLVEVSPIAVICSNGAAHIIWHLLSILPVEEYDTNLYILEVDSHALSCRLREFRVLRPNKNGFYDL
jgi:hypothetical protein